MRIIMLAALGFAVVAAAVAASAAPNGYRVDWYVVSAGGGQMTGGSFKLNCTVAQPAAGSATGTNLLHLIGFWVGEAAEPRVVPTIAEAKLLADGTFVSVAGMIATSDAGDFDGFFYVEDAGRASGIRVQMDPGAVAGLVRGSVVNVIGTLGTAANGERQFEGAVVIITATASPLAPVGMPNRSLGGSNWGAPPLGQYGVLGGAGLNTVGLLVRCWGRVTAVGPGCVVIDDGSGPVRVDTSVLASPPPSGSYIGVVGISSIYAPESDRFKLLLPRDDADVVTH